MSTFPRGPQGRHAPRLQRLDSLKNPQPRSFSSAVRKSPPPKQQRKAVTKECPNPECREKDIAEEEGHLICRGCGTVVQESNFSSEVTWADNPNGAAVVQGSFLGPNQTHARGATVKGHTIVNAEERRALRESEGTLRLPQPLEGQNSNGLQLGGIWTSWRQHLKSQPISWIEPLNGIDLLLVPTSSKVDVLNKLPLCAFMLPADINSPVNLC